MAMKAERAGGETMKRVRAKKGAVRKTTAKSTFDLDEAVAAEASGGAATTSYLPAMFTQPRLGRSVSRRQVTTFLRQLIMLLEAGTPLLKSLNAMRERGETAAVRRMVADIANYVESGNALWQAMERHTGSFLPVEINLIKAAEASGTLTTVLRRIVTYRERQAMLGRRVISALLYPCILVLACAAVLFIIAKVVVPEFKELFDRLGVETPAATQYFFTTVEFLTGGPFIIAMLLVIVALVILYIMVTRTPNGRKAVDYFKVRYIPWVSKRIVRKFAVIELTRSLSLMLRSGLSMLVTLDLVRSVVTNQAVAGVMQHLRDAVERGEGIERPLRQNEHLIPSIVTDMLVTGEEAGQLDQIAEHIAETYEEELAIDLNSLGEIIQPAVTIFIGILVALLFAVLFQPMVDMMTQLNAQGGA